MPVPPPVTDTVYGPAPLPVTDCTVQPVAPPTTLKSLVSSPVTHWLKLTENVMVPVAPVARLARSRVAAGRGLRDQQR